MAYDVTMRERRVPTRARRTSTPQSAGQGPSASTGSSAESVQLSVHCRKAGHALSWSKHLPRSSRPIFERRPTDLNECSVVMKQFESPRIKGWFYLLESPADRIPGLLTWQPDRGATLELIGDLSPGPVPTTTRASCVQWTTAGLPPMGSLRRLKRAVGLTQQVIDPPAESHGGSPTGRGHANYMSLSARPSRGDWASSTQ